MDDGNTCKIIVGPGAERWPGSPHNKNVDNVEAQLVVPGPEAEPAKDVKTEKLMHAMRLKVMSSVQIAAKRFSEDDVRAMVEQALANARTHNDYS